MQDNKTTPSESKTSLTVSDAIKTIFSDYKGADTEKIFVFKNGSAVTGCKSKEDAIFIIKGYECISNNKILS